MITALHDAHSNVLPPSDSSSSILDQRIQLALSKSPYRPVRSIQCRVHEGLIMLQGTLPNYHCVQIAIAIAKAHLNSETQLRVNLKVE